MSDNSIIQLVERARGGERGAYGELVQRYERAVYAAVVRQLRDRTEAEDVTQEAFVHGLRKLGQLRDPRCFGGWLRRAAVRLALNRASRRRLCQHLKDDGATALAAPAAEPLETLLHAERSAALQRGLARLKPLDRQTLVAFYLDGRSHQEMARIFHASIGTIKSRLHTARRRLRRQLQRLELAS